MNGRPAGQDRDEDQRQMQDRASDEGAEPGPQRARADEQVCPGFIYRATSLDNLSGFSSTVASRVHDSASVVRLLTPITEKIKALQESNPGLPYVTTDFGSAGAVVRVSPGTLTVSARPFRGKVKKRLKNRTAAAIGEGEGSDSVSTGRVNVDGKYRSYAITGFTASARRNLITTMLSIDYQPMIEQGAALAMVTFTAPGPWEKVFYSKKIAMRHLKLFMARVNAQFGYSPAHVWKLEFQKRGAPHFHVLMAVPDVLDVLRDSDWSKTYDSVELNRHPGRKGEVMREFLDLEQNLDVESKNPGLNLDVFRHWAGDTWAAVVNRPIKGDVTGEFPLTEEEYRAHRNAGVGVDLYDNGPGRGWQDFTVFQAANYFAKHGSNKGAKEYQHEVPDLWLQNGGVGAFWGYAGVSKVQEEIPVTHAEQVLLARIVLKWHMARLRSQLREARSLRHRSQDPSCKPRLAISLGLRADYLERGAKWGLSGRNRLVRNHRGSMHVPSAPELLKQIMIAMVNPVVLLQLMSEDDRKIVSAAFYRASDPSRAIPDGPRSRYRTARGWQYSYIRDLLTTYRAGGMSQFLCAAILDQYRLDFGVEMQSHPYFLDHLRAKGELAGLLHRYLLD